MAYRRRRYRRRRSFRRRRGFYRRVGYFGAAGSKYGPELKFYEDFSSTASIQTDGTVCDGAMNLIPGGSGISQHNGFRAVLKSMHIRASIAAPNTSDEGIYVRILLVLDKQCNGAAAIPQDVLYHSTDLVTASAEYLAFNNLANKRRFRVLKDQIFSLPAVYSTAYNGTTNACRIVSVPFEWHIPFKTGLPIRYDTTGTPTVSNVQSNNLFMLAYSSSDGNNNPALHMNYRLRFTD